MTIVASSTADTANSVGDTMTSGSADAVGAWDEAIASAPVDTHWVQISFQATQADETYLVNIGIGAIGVEAIEIENIYFFGNNNGTISFKLPLEVASGERVSVQCRASSSAATLRYSVHLSDDSDLGTSTSNVTLGAVPGSSKGTDIDPGGTNNTPGGYVEFSASMPINANFIIVCLGNSDNNAQANLNFLANVATGVSLSEVDVIDNMIFDSSASEKNSVQKTFLQALDSGERISMNAQCNDTSDSNDRVIDAVLLCFKLDPPAGGSGGIAQIVGQGGIVG